MQFIEFEKIKINGIQTLAEKRLYTLDILDTNKKNKKIVYIIKDLDIYDKIPEFVTIKNKKFYKSDISYHKSNYYLVEI